MSSILNAFRSAQAPARHFAAPTIASSSTLKSAFHPEHQSVVLQQLVESISPRATGVTPSGAVRQTMSSLNSVKTTASATSSTARQTKV
ncbi:hypothetical protein BX616_003368 [Lobosporangium transversale]|nr:hypothetical protein BX616_003368 [Lobosporangium transversale]